MVNIIKEVNLSDNKFEKLVKGITPLLAEYNVTDKLYLKQNYDADESFFTLEGRYQDLNPDLLQILDDTPHLNPGWNKTKFITLRFNQLKMNLYLIVFILNIVIFL